MGYEKKIEQNGALATVVYENSNGVRVSKSKGEIRNALVAAGIDPEDVLADISNSLSLMISLTSRMYGVMPEEQKANLLPADRTLIEYVFKKHLETNTTADLKLSSEGTTMIDNIFTRWSTITNIVNSIKKFVTTVTK